MDSNEVLSSVDSVNNCGCESLELSTPAAVTTDVVTEDKPKTVSVNKAVGIATACAVGGAGVGIGTYFLVRLIVNKVKAKKEAKENSK